MCVFNIIASIAWRKYDGVADKISLNVGSDLRQDTFGTLYASICSKFVVFFLFHSRNLNLNSSSTFRIILCRV